MKTRYIKNWRKFYNGEKISEMSMHSKKFGENSKLSGKFLRWKCGMKDKEKIIHMWKIFCRKCHIKNLKKMLYLWKNLRDENTIRVPPWLKVHFVKMLLCIDVTTANYLSNEPKTKAADENLTSVQSVESLVTKKWLLQKRFECCAFVIESKNTSKSMWVEYSSGMDSVTLPHPTIYHSGHYWGLGAQKMRIDTVDPVVEQRSEHHFNILQTYLYIRTNKEKDGAMQVRNNCYPLVMVCSYTPWRVKLTINKMAV